MNKPTPKVDQRRTEALFAELLARAQTWIPGWQPTGSERDFGHALLQIAARLSSEVTERLDRTPAKAALGLLDWLGITRLAGNAARMPVVFKMTDNATDTVFAPARSRIQANVGDTPVAFETGMEVQLVPAPIRQIVGVDPDADAIYFPPADVLNLEPPTLGPTEWTVKSLASANSAKLQLTPPLGLQKDTILQVAGLEYRIVGEPQGDLVTVEPAIGVVDPGTVKKPVGAGVDIREAEIVKKVRNFIPFDGSTRNLQEHALYIGDDEMLNLTASASIALSGVSGLPDDLVWEYWGKLGDGDPVWNELGRLASEGTNLLLEFPKKQGAQVQTGKKGSTCSIEQVEIAGRGSRWIRARRTAGDKPQISFSDLKLLINCVTGSEPDRGVECERAANMDATEVPKLEGVANTTALVLNQKFYPLGKIPRQFDSFYLACPEVFSKKRANATIHFDVADSTVSRLAVARDFTRDNTYAVFGVSNDGALQRYKFFSDVQPPIVYLKTTFPRPDARSRIVTATSGEPDFRDLEPAVAPLVIDILSWPRQAKILMVSGRDVWKWEEDFGTTNASWSFFGTVGDQPNTKPISQLILLKFPAWPDYISRLVALADGVLYTKDYNPRHPVVDYSWNPIDFGSDKDKKWARIAAIQASHPANGVPAEVFDNIFVALDSDGNLEWLQLDPAKNQWNPTLVTTEGKTTKWDIGVAPLVVNTDKGILLVVKEAMEEATAPQLQALLFTFPASVIQNNINAKDISTVVLPSDGNIIAGHLTHQWMDGFSGTGDSCRVLFTLSSSQTTSMLAWWMPFDDTGLFVSDPVSSGGTLKSAPAVVGTSVLVTGATLDMLVTELNSDTPLHISNESLLDGVTTPPVLSGNDWLELTNFQNEILFSSWINLGENSAEKTYEYLKLQPGFGRVSSVRVFPVENHAVIPADSIKTLPDNKIQLDITNYGSFAKDLVKDDSIVLLMEYDGLDAKNPLGGWQNVKVVEVDLKENLLKVSPEKPLDKLSTITQVRLYKKKDILDLIVQPILLLKPGEGFDDDTLKLLEKNRTLYFFAENGNQTSQSLLYDNIDITSQKEKFSVLSSPWTKLTKPGDNKLIVKVASGQGEWIRFVGNTPSNPDLSWEYWNGNGWWSLEAGSGDKRISDSTENLKQTGCIQFVVPDDLQSTDVVLGKKSYWIRARLVGGDYGRESFVITTTPAQSGHPAGTQNQSVTVNTDNIRVPIVRAIRITYSICTAAAPKYLLAFDSRSWLDQSDANRTQGATVDAFVPVAERLRQLSGPPAASSGSAGMAVIPCDCSRTQAVTPTASSVKPSCAPTASLQVVGKNQDKTVKVLSTTPVRNAVEVAIDSSIVAVFSEPLNPVTVNVSTFQLRDNADALLPVTITYNPVNNTATLKPDAVLAQAQTYTAIIRGGTSAPNVSAQSGNPLAADVTWTFTTAASSSRAIYLVFDKEIKGTPIRILFLLEDRNHDQATPMVVEALRNNRFEPVGVEDKTRALGESGLLTLSLDGPPSLAELFGISGFWLRLRPGSSAAAATWSPCILGAYVNSVWASAEETQETEILGSSDGSPFQRVVLTRPPVLRDSLQLRVRELLGDEEMQQLARTPDLVKENVPGLPGRWVLWKEVVDPGDAGPDERVYALDPFNGEIRFGDGVHGAIPPIGRDAIVAFEYRHGGEAAANRVPAFTPLNLVSPIAGVESAITPDSAAGGSDPEDVETVRRFAAARLRHRDRAVSLRDLEDLALHFSDDIAQARAFSGAGGTRLVVVLGSRDPNHSIANRSNPDPSQALSRELRRYLLEHASPALARRGALTIVKADRVNFRINLRLRVVSLDVTGSVGEAVKLAVQRLFDPAFGGYDGLGWRIGDALSSDDVAARLLAVENIDNLDSILFIRDKAGALPVEQLSLSSAQLAWLLEDGISIQFTTKEVPA